MVGIGKKITSARHKMIITETLIKIKQGCFCGQVPAASVKPRLKQSLTYLLCDTVLGSHTP